MIAHSALCTSNSMAKTQLFWLAHENAFHARRQDGFL
jgi:hypothetical protein